MIFAYAQPTEYTECQAFCPGVRIGSPYPPHPQESVDPPPFGQGGDTLACGGGGGFNSDEGTDTLVLFVYYNHSTAQPKGIR
jgi:hypothetical protein